MQDQDENETPEAEFDVFEQTQLQEGLASEDQPGEEAEREKGKKKGKKGKKEKKDKKKKKGKKAKKK